MFGSEEEQRVIGGWWGERLGATHGRGQFKIPEKKVSIPKLAELIVAAAGKFCERRDTPTAFHIHGAGALFEIPHIYAKLKCWRGIERIWQGWQRCFRLLECRVGEGSGKGGRG